MFVRAGVRSHGFQSVFRSVPIFLHASTRLLIWFSLLEELVNLDIHLVVEPKIHLRFGASVGYRHQYYKPWIPFNCFLA